MKLNIAVIGSGSAGATAALYFHKNGHKVTVFEREAEPKPVGAGIMLQPTGLNTLADLGLAKKALTLGHKIDGFYGEDKNGKVVLDFMFKNDDKLTGLGINRGALYFLMYDELIRQGIEIKLDAEIVEVKDEHIKKDLVDAKGNTYEGFDLIIAANGARSNLRKQYGQAKIDCAQEYGALWAKLPYDNSVFNHKIYQKYDGAHTMIGFMPMGKPTENAPEEVNFFWSISVQDIQKWKDSDLGAWKNQVKAFCPEHAPIIDLIESKDQIMVAPYLDVVLKPSFSNRIVFVGDAAHPMSPQLAQGAGFAMLDSRILAEEIQKNLSNIDLALELYHRKRSKQVYFYQSMSRFLTPMFQSNTNSTLLRNTMFLAIHKLSPFKRIMNATILGYRESLFGNIDKKYYQKVA